MKRVLSLLLFLLAFCVLPTWGQFLPVEGKYYTITMKTNSSQYMVENADGTLGVTAYSTSERIFWEFIPAETAGSFYMRNATTKRYVMSCSGAQKTKISTQETPVEYYVAVSGSYVRFTSTDCANYDNTSATPNGLNKDGSNSDVIIWAAGASNNNSWWQLAETDYLFESRPTMPHTSFMRSAQIYDNPCASTSDVYIYSVQAQGHEADQAVKFPATGTRASRPSNGYQLYTKVRGEMRRGHDFQVTVNLSKTPSEGDSLYVYFDYDRDGVFEVCLRPEVMERDITFKTTTPADAPLGWSRMRIRLTNNGLAGADDEACGQMLDCVVSSIEVIETPVGVVEVAPDLQISVADRTLRVSTDDEVISLRLYSAAGNLVAQSRGTSLALPSATGVYVVNVRTARHASSISSKIVIR